MTAMPPDTAPRCNSCQFWLPQPSRQDRPIGECRRHPPTLVIWRSLLDRMRGRRQSSAVYPRTLAGEWCGEHRQPGSVRLTLIRTQM